MIYLRTIFAFLLAATLAGAGQTSQSSARPQAQPKGAQRNSVPPPAEDISGMYSFLKEGEFLQIILDHEGVSGYISRFGDLESDRGSFLDQFFSKASVQGHDVTFTTKVIHGVWFEFKGRFDRGPAKSKAKDGYYVLRGTLTEFISDADKKVTSRSQEAEFKLLAQPDDEAEPKGSADQPKK
jgi:hypothetical protein